VWSCAGKQTERAFERLIKMAEVLFDCIRPPFLFRGFFSSFSFPVVSSLRARKNLILSLTPPLQASEPCLHIPVIFRYDSFNLQAQVCECLYCCMHTAFWYRTAAALLLLCTGHNCSITKSNHFSLLRRRQPQLYSSDLSLAWAANSRRQTWCSCTICICIICASSISFECE